MRRLVAVHAAEVCRVADGAADVAADLERDQSCGQCSRSAAGGATHGSFWIPWVPGQAVDVVVALEVNSEERDVGLSQDDGAGFGEAFHRHRVGVRHVIAELRRSAGGDQAGRLEQILDCDRQAVERANRLAGSQCLICGDRLRARPFEVGGHHDVEARIQGLDACNGFVDEFNRADVTTTQGGHALRSGPILTVVHVSPLVEEQLGDVGHIPKTTTPRDVALRHRWSGSACSTCLHLLARPSRPRVGQSSRQARAHSCLRRRRCRTGPAHMCAAPCRRGELGPMR